MDNTIKRPDTNPQQERRLSDFVLDKDIFSNIFDKDIRRVYLYKKAERLAKALHVITPAFASSPTLSARIDGIAVALVDAAILPPMAARPALSRELLTLSSLLAVARTGSLLSAMNAEIIGREAQILLQELASYEEPRLALEEAPTLAALARDAAQAASNGQRQVSGSAYQVHAKARGTGHGRTQHSIGHKGQHSDSGANVVPREATSSRREAILEVVGQKGKVYIKDVSTVVRGVSEKTIQRELQALTKEGVIRKEGERRWTLYSLV